MDTLDASDLLFSVRLEQWTTLRRPLADLFDEREIDALLRAGRTFRRSKRNVVFLSFENRFVSLGGLAPVMNHLPAEAARQGERCVVVTPFHGSHSAMCEAVRSGAIEPCFQDKCFRLCEFASSVSCHRDMQSGFHTYYVEIPGCFSAGENPYEYCDPDLLLRDALAFAAALPVVCESLGMSDHLLFHAHEWETAAVAMTSKMAVIGGRLRQAHTVLTLHNSFDHELPEQKQREFFGTKLPGDTVLQCSLPFLDGPLSTVSSPFARELSHDPLQTEVFTNHLRRQFMMNPPLGIENGVFGDDCPKYSQSVICRARTGRVDSLLRRKRWMRRMLMSSRIESRNDRVIGSLSLDTGDTMTPILFMGGRLDPMQKGFDVMFAAFERLKRGSAKLLFVPSSMTGARPDALEYFSQTAARCAGDIEIWPFKLPRHLYVCFLGGSSYQLMPSLYEPFGSANEGLAAGTPVIARATGGLWLQVRSSVPVAVPSLYGEVSPGGQSDVPTGILFRESQADGGRLPHEWHTLLHRPPADRIDLPLFGRLTDAAHEALSQAIRLHETPASYASMIANGLQDVRRFTWDRAFEKHRRIYDRVSSDSPV